MNDQPKLSADCDMLDPEDFRGILRDIAEVEAVGFEKALQIAERVAPAEMGIRTKIPLGPASDLWKLRARHDRLLTRAFFTTASVNEIVREHGISRNAVLRHFRRMRDDGFHRPEKPKNGRAACAAGRGRISRQREKIRISGGGRCNFTNLHVKPQCFLPDNPHFAKSALSRYTQHDFIALVERYGIAYHEKTLGQLFCDTSARLVVDMLCREMAAAGVDMRLETRIGSIARTESGFRVALEEQGEDYAVSCDHLVVTCGGKSIPKMGATGFGYRVASQFGLAVTDTRPGLVPLTFGEDVLAEFKPLAGVSVHVEAACAGTRFLWRGGGSG